MNAASFSPIQNKPTSWRNKTNRNLKSLSHSPINLPKKSVTPTREQEIRADLLLKYDFQLLKVLRNESRKIRNTRYIPTPYDRMMDIALQSMKKHPCTKFDLKNYPTPKPRPFIKKGQHYAIVSFM